MSELNCRLAKKTKYRNMIVLTLKDGKTNDDNTPPKLKSVNIISLKLLLFTSYYLHLFYYIIIFPDNSPDINSYSMSTVFTKPIY